MARDFSFKDARRCIESLDSLIEELSETSEYRKIKAKEIRELFDALENSGFFSDAVNSELSGTPFSQKNNKYDRLLVNIFHCIQSRDSVSRAKELLAQIDEEVSSDITILEANSNPVLWIFSSKKNKQLANIAFEKLSAFIDSSVIKEANDTIQQIDNLSSVTLDEIENHFLENKGEYEKLIKKIIKTPDYDLAPKIIRNLSNKYQLLKREIDSVKQGSTQITEEIIKAIDRLVTQELLKVLREASIEEVNRDKKGIRVKALRDAGYTSMADVVTADMYNLSSVYGISQDNAFTIKRIAEDYARQARKAIKIKLSYDDRNKAANEVIKRIYVYRQKRECITEIERVEKKYNEKINQSVSALNEIGSGRFWTFYTDNHKNQVKELINDFGSVLSDEYGTVISNATNRYNGLSTAVALDKAWNDFKTNSIDYYTIIEEIYPGVLGTDDSLYGLPEDLAREIQDECFFPDGLLCTLRRYQEWGVKYILHQERVLLGDEMGLGKTIQAIATMVSLKNTGATHFVVVCPASVITNWCREIVEHSKLKVMKAHGREKDSVVKAWIKNGGVIVTTYESTSAFQLDPYFRFSQLVVDEAHYIKNKGAARTTRTVDLSKHADRVLLMTGTPLENKVEEMISLVDILNPDMARQISSIAFMSAAPQFRERIAPVYYRRKREDVLTELPDKIESEEWCTMSKEEEEVYKNTLFSYNQMAIRQVSWNVGDIHLSSKMNRLKEIIEDAKNDDRKILVFSYFLDTISKIVRELGRVCLNPINGSVSPSRRQEIIDEFEKAPAGTVLCAQILAGGTGLNIQAASVVVICEPQLKPSVENQAISRAYRMGQARNVQVFRLLCEDTIDERLFNVLKEKQAIFDAFADKSVAAQNVEIDDKTIGDIIKDEIESIKQKQAEQGETDGETKKVEKWEKAKDTYWGLPVSVTTRMTQVSQPYGGYINPRDMEIIHFPTDIALNSRENLAPSLIGTAVDYLTRYMLEKDAYKAFGIPINGAYTVNEWDVAQSLLASISGLDDTSIISAVKMTGFDCVVRAGIDAYRPVEDIDPDDATIHNVRTMVKWSNNFFKSYGQTVKYNLTFAGGYTKVIGSGDGDYMTSDTLWDFKVSKNEPSNIDTFQLLIYYIMGLHSIHQDYKNIKYLGIFNPRRNTAYRYPVDKIDAEKIKRIEEEVIGY